MESWGTEETKKKDSDIARKIIIGMLVLLLIIIVSIIILLYTIKENVFTILLDGTEVVETNGLLIEIENTTYINIEKMARLIGYDYHSGEYKGYSSTENDKCYIQSNVETASFYLNSNKVCKLKVGAIKEDYEVLESNKSIILRNNMFYAPVDAIEIAFNVLIEEKTNGMSIMTLKTLVNTINKNINGTNETTAIYNSLLNEDFDNQKALLYDFVIVSKKQSNLYGIMTTAQKEILPDKYIDIKFLESTKEFLVTNNSGKMGIVDEKGRNKVEQLYDSIKVIDNNPKLYLVKISNKYGVINENGGTIVYPEYDSIGIDTTKYKDIQNQYVLFNKIIPVCKENKYGLFNINGEKVLNVQYDGIGCELQSVSINGISKAVNPTVIIEDCEAIVIKNGERYDIFLIKESKYQKISEAIYYLTEQGKKTYYMLLNEKAYDLIDELIKAKVISKESEDDATNIITNENTTSNQIEENYIS